MKKRRIDQLYMLLLGVAVILVVYGARHFEVDNIKIDNEPVETFDENWLFIRESSGESKTVQLPVREKTRADETIVLTNSVPEEWSGKTMLLKTKDQIMQVYLNGNLHYTFGTEDKRAFGRTPGTGLHFIKLPEITDSEQILITLTSPYHNKAGIIHNITIGSKAACIFFLLKENAVTFLICLAIFLFGILLGIIYLFCRRLETDTTGLLYLSEYALCIFVYYAIETGLFQYFYGNSSVYSLMTFLSIMLAPIPMVRYAGEGYLRKYKKAMDGLCLAFILNFTIQVLLQAAGAADFMELSPITHILVVFSVMYTMVCIFFELKQIRTAENALAMAGFSIMQLCILGDIVMYYLFKSQDIARLQRFGSAAYIAIFSSVTIGKIITLSKQGLENESLKKAAYIDETTGFKNRISFDKKMSEMEVKPEECHNRGIIIFELAELRTINERMGYNIGTKVLLCAARAVSAYFESIGDIYRLSGRVFAVMTRDVAMSEVEEALIGFESEIQTERYNFGFVFHVPYGKAGFNIHEDFDLHSTYVRADMALEAHKRNIKAVNYE